MKDYEKMINNVLGGDTTDISKKTNWKDKNINLNEGAANVTDSVQRDTSTDDKDEEMPFELAEP